MALGFLSDIPTTIPGLSDVGGVLNNVPGLGNLTSILGGDTSNQPPILTQLPKAQLALQTKYSDPTFTGALQSMPPYIANAFTNYDQARVAKGQMPLTAPQTVGALNTAVNNTPATPPPHQNFLQNAVSDIGSIVSSIPMLPVNLIKEAEALPEAPQKLSEALGAGSIPGILQGLTQVPGLRMVPGVNTAAELFNDPGQLLQHPVMTALDVLPYAEPLAGSLTENLFSRLPSVQEARANFDVADFNASRLEHGLQPVTDNPSALSLWAQNNPQVQWFANSPIGSTFSKLFGPTARDNAQLFSGTQNKWQLIANGNADIPGVTPDIAHLQDAITAANNWSKVVPEQRMVDLTQGIVQDRNAVLNDPTLTDAERGMVNEYLTHSDNLANYGLQLGLTNTVDGEIFTPQEANRILNARQNLQRYQTLNDGRNLLAQATPANADQTLAAIDPTQVLSEHLNRPAKLDLAEAQARAMTAAGYDTGPVLDAIKYARNQDVTVPVETIKSMLDDQLANPTPAPAPMTAADISQQLAPYQGRVTAPGDPTVAQVRALLDNGDYQGAVERMRLINQRSTYSIPGADDMLNNLTQIRDNQKFIDRISKYNDRAVAQRANISANIEAETAPARFYPLIEKQVEGQLLDKYATDPAALQLIHDHLYTMLPDMAPNELSNMFRSAAKGWQDLKAAGYDPAFVHRMSPTAVPRLGQVDLADTLRTPASVKARTFDATPYVPNMAMAMSDEAMGFLRRRAAEEYTGIIQDLYGKTTAELQARYLPQARAAAEAQPGLDVAAHLQNLIRTGHTEYDPASIFGHTTGHIGTLGGQEDMWLPKPVSNTMKQLFHDYNSNPVSKLFDPVMKVFRTAIIPLSVRSFMHHFFGAGVMLAGESDPGVFFRQWQAARDLIKNGDFEKIPGKPPSGLGEGPANGDLVAWGRKATKSDQVLAAHDLMAGSWVRKNIFDRLGPVKDASGNVLNRITDFRQKMDDQYRAMAYLEGKQKALKLDPTLTDEQATQAGVGLVRKTMQSWDRMTPMERQTIRMVMPFYGYMSHMMKYAFRYPMDHPWRVGVLDNFARNEVNDFGQALPANLMDALFLGSPDPKTGMVNSLNLQQFNPFHTLPSYFTMAGFTGASNPVIQSVLRAVGVDPAKGAPSLYPDVAYDPATGQLRPDNPALLSSFVSNLIPQTQILSAMIGRNDQFKQILKANPDAAAAMMQSSLGLPNLFANINPTVEATKAEVARQTLQDQVKNQALSSGDWSKAMQFPGLAPFFNQLGQVLQQNPTALSAYQTQVQQGQQTPNSSALTPGAT